jgi:hypothetical protein
VMSFHDRSFRCSLSLACPPDVIIISKVVGDLGEIVIPVTKTILVAPSVLVVVMVFQQSRFHGHAAHLHPLSAL